MSRSWRATGNGESIHRGIVLWGKRAGEGSTIHCVDSLIDGNAGAFRERNLICRPLLPALNDLELLSSLNEIKSFSARQEQKSRSQFATPASMPSCPGKPISALNRKLSACSGKKREIAETETTRLTAPSPGARERRRTGPGN